MDHHQEGIESDHLASDPDDLHAEDDLEAANAARAPEPEDRLSRLLRLVAAGLLVVVLVAAVSFALYLQTLGAPRSAAERDIERYKTAVAEQPKVLDNYVKLAYAYAIADRYDDAMTTIDSAQRLTKAPQIQVQLAKADILRAAERYDEAIGIYNKVASLAEEEYAVQSAELKKQQIAYIPPNTTLASVLRGRGIAKWDSGDTDGAIADLNAALDIEPTDAATMVRIGGYYAESGDTSMAVAAYRQALHFVPDSPEAIAGLRELGEGR